MTPRPLILDRFNKACGLGLTLGEVRHHAGASRTGHGIKITDPIYGDLNEIFNAHKRRVAGLGCPHECDAITERLIRDGRAG